MTATTTEQATATDAAAVLTDRELLAWARAEADRWKTDGPQAVVHWSAALDNHSPARNHAYGYGVLGRNERGETIMTLRTRGMLRDAERAVYLVDDGKSVTAMYVTGYGHKTRPDFLAVASLPTNPDGETDKRGDVIAYANWRLGPSRAYHFKVVPVPSGVAL